MKFEKYSLWSFIVFECNAGYGLYLSPQFLAHEYENGVRPKLALFSFERITIRARVANTHQCMFLQ